jgi:hypothetical protein
LIRCGMHSGDLGGHHDTPGQAGFPGTSLALQTLPAPEIPGNTSKPKGAPRNYQDWASSCTGTRSGEDGDSNESCLAGGGDYRPPVARGDVGSICRARFWGAPLATFLAPCFRDTRICGWKRSGAPSTRSAPASAPPTRSAKMDAERRQPAAEVSQSTLVQYRH